MSQLEVDKIIPQSGTTLTIGDSGDTITFGTGTTPQLGGDLDTNGNNINFGDNDKAVFGAGNDLQIYHDGSDSYIDDVGAGNLIVKAGSLRIKASNDESMIDGNANGAVNLYYDNSKKFETTSSGVTINGGTNTNVFFQTTGSGTSGTDGMVVGNVGGDSSSYQFYNYESGYMRFATSNAEAMRIASDGSVGIGTTAPSTGYGGTISNVKLALRGVGAGGSNGTSTLLMGGDNNHYSYLSSEHTGGGDTYLAFGTSLGATNPAERMRIERDGDILINKTVNSFTTAGHILNANGTCFHTRSGEYPLALNRLSNDGHLLALFQANTEEGSITVSGATVAYNGFTGTHWSRLSDNSKPTILKGTILESLDEMMDWYQVEFDITDEEGNTITKKESYTLGDGENVGDVITYNYEGTDYQATIIQEGDVKHTKSKISDTVDAKNVYGVFMDWDNDDDTVNDMYVAQTGTFVVRINGSKTVSKGDLIQSNGDGTGKVQADDIIRASTVAKVLSTTKIETYDDGSYIVPCSLHC